MTLNEFVNQVCLTVNKPDNDSRSAAATFIANRYKMIYDAHPWRDSELISVVSPIITSGSGPIPDGGPDHVPFQGSTFLTFPENTDRIVKVGLIATAGGTRAVTDLRPTDSAALLESRPDALLSSGTPEFYEEINDTNGRFIQIYPSLINGSYKFIVVGKRTCSTLVNSNDTPILRNIDNALIAFAIADMLKRDRHYVKADQQFKEAQALLQEAIDLEQKQSNAPRAARPLSVTGGTLAELTDAVSSKLGLWDVANQNRIQEAIRRKYQELYDRELWTDSVVILSMQSQLDQLVLPAYVDKFIGVLNQANQTIDIAEAEYLFRTNPAIFDATGSPFVCTPLPPVAVRVLPAAEEQLSFVSSNPDDAFSVSIVGFGNGVERSEVVSVTSGTGVSAFSYLFPLVISKPPSLGTLTISGASSLVKFGEIPAELSSVQYQRIWVKPIDSTSANDYYLVLGKRRLKQLVAPTDAVSIRGCENALINMACGEIAAPDQAAAFKQEAESQIQILIGKETNQNARRTTVTPYTDRDCDTDSEFWLRG